MANGLGTFLPGAVGGLLGLAGGISSAFNQRRQQTRFRRRQRRAIGGARTFAEERLQELLGPRTLFGQGEEFLRGTFGAAAESPLAQDFVKQIRAAQAARGTLAGGAPEAAEAGGLAAFSQQLRASLLPQLQAFAFAPEQLRQSIIGFEAPLRVAARTGAALPGITPPQIAPDILTGALSQATAGFLGGAQIGASAEQLQEERRRLEEERRIRRSQTLRPQGDVLDESAQAVLGRIAGTTPALTDPALRLLLGFGG